MAPARRLLSALSAVFAVAAAGGARAGGDDLSQDMSLGSPTAPVTLIEYASPTCPHCARFEAGVFPAFKAKYVDTGKVRYVLREAPIHPDLDAAAFLLARCAGGSAGYFNVIEGVMKGQDEYYAPYLMQSPNPSQDMADAYRAVLRKVGAAAGLDEQHVRTCLTNEASLNALSDRAEREMKQYEVHSTPTFVVNGVKLDPEHETDLAALDAAIASALGKSGPAQSDSGKPASHAKRR